MTTPTIAFVTDGIPFYLLGDRSVSILKITQGIAEVFLKGNKQPTQWKYNTIGGNSLIFDYFLGAERQFCLDRTEFKLLLDETILIVELSPTDVYVIRDYYLLSSKPLA